MFWWTVLIISLISSVESHGGHGYGSHSHMPKHNKHEHYKPVLPEGDEANNKVPAYALLKDKKLLQDAEHIREDLGDIMPGVDLSKMGEEELEFHYFKLHDYDGNNKLDGLEIMSAITHILPSIESELGEETEQADPEAYRRRRLMAQERRLREINYQFAPMIDRLLKDDDQDNDGYLNYAEFSLSKRKGARIQT